MEAINLRIFVEAIRQREKPVEIDERKIIPIVRKTENRVEKQEIRKDDEDQQPYVIIKNTVRVDPQIKCRHQNQQNVALTSIRLGCTDITPFDQIYFKHLIFIRNEIVEVIQKFSVQNAYK